MSKRALIFGVSGQDGVYLSRLLLEKGYEVHGTSRDAAVASFSGLRRLKLLEKIKVHSVNLTDYRTVLDVLRTVKPTEIYNLSAQSSVGLSFDQPTETLSSIANATLNLLEAIRFMGGDMRIYNASSSEMFGDTGGKPADEMTAFRPHSHYGVSKASAHWFVEGYRNGYGLFACSGIAFNHESPLRSERFVTQKIVRAAVEIKCGSSNRLKLGNTSIVRDWGWAPEYADAMWRMLQRDAPADFVLATGIPSSLEEFIAASFGHLGLDWRNHVDRDGAFMRPYELAYSVGNAAKAARELKWKATVTMPGLVASLVEGELERSSA